MTRPHNDSSKTYIGVMWALGLSAFLISADNRAIAPMLPAISHSLHITSAAAAVLVSAYSLPYGLFQLMFGPIADRFGKVRIIRVALGLFAVGTIGCGLVSGFRSLLLLRVITGIFAAGVIPTALAYIGDLFELNQRSRMIAFFMSVTTTGQASGIVIGGIVAQFASYRLLFILVGASVIPTLLSLRPRRSTVRADAPSVLTFPFRKAVVSLFSQSRSWLVYGLVMFEGFMFWGGFTFLAVYGKDVLHLSYVAVGLITAMYSLGGFIGSRTLSFALPHIGYRRMPVFGAMLMSLSYGLSWIWESPWTLCLGFLLLGFGYSYCHSTLQTFATDLLPEGRATAVSVFGFSLYLGGGIGPMAIGIIYSGYGAIAMLEASTLGMVLFSAACLSFLMGRIKFFTTNESLHA